MRSFTVILLLILDYLRNFATTNEEKTICAEL